MQIDDQRILRLVEDMPFDGMDRCVIGRFNTFALKDGSFVFEGLHDEERFVLTPSEMASLVDNLFFSIGIRGMFDHRVWLITPNLFPLVRYHTRGITTDQLYAVHAAVHDGSDPRDLAGYERLQALFTEDDGRSMHPAVRLAFDVMIELLFERDERLKRGEYQY